MAKVITSAVSVTPQPDDIFLAYKRSYKAPKPFSCTIYHCHILDPLILAALLVDKYPYTYASKTTTSTTMLVRTISKDMATALRPRPTIPIDSNTAIMYDPLNRTLFRGSIKSLANERTSLHPHPHPFLPPHKPPNKQLTKNTEHIPIPIKNRNTKLDLRIPLRRPSSSSTSTSTTPGEKGAQDEDEEDDDDTGIYLATVDLRRLGRQVKNGVRSGEIKRVYVLGYVPGTLMERGRDEDGEVDAELM
jgi:hypothetical protein